MNLFQKAIAKTYGGGDYAYLVELPETEERRAYRDIGDGLFSFLMAELADDGEPMNSETARNRIESAIRDLQFAVDETDAVEQAE